MLEIARRAVTTDVANAIESVATTNQVCFKIEQAYYILNNQ